MIVMGNVAGYLAHDIASKFLYSFTYYYNACNGNAVGDLAGNIVGRLAGNVAAGFVGNCAGNFSGNFVAV